MSIGVIGEARLRARNQLTLPEPVVQAAGIAEGDRFVVEVTPGDPDTLRLHRIRPGYAGSLCDAYGDPVEFIDISRRSGCPRERLRHTSRGRVTTSGRSLGSRRTQRRS